MKKTVVLNVVGLTPNLIGEHTPNLLAVSQRCAVASIGPVYPAVTCSVQATYLTGTWPSEHGIVGNGWYFRDECEVRFWRQSNRLVQRAKIWERAKALDPAFTCANLFWWYNMHSSADYTVTPRPMYPADGRKLPDIYTQPANLRDSFQHELGPFPLFCFWGPATSIKSSEWIAQSAMSVERRFNPTLTLIYLPHLDYCLQRNGPDPVRIASDLRDIDRVCGELITFYESRGASVTILSEYGIARVNRPVHLNRVLRSAGLLQVRNELDRELLDAGASQAFAVADHQLAHVYVKDPKTIDYVKSLLTATPGVACVLGEAGKRELHLDHPRSGELVALADPDAWFTYYYWLDDSRMPDFARTVDIHRKPGYDPAELFLDPAIRLPKLKIATRLIQKKLGMRYLMDVIPTNGDQVKGSHGLAASAVKDAPLLMTTCRELLLSNQLTATEVYGILWKQLTRL